MRKLKFDLDVNANALLCPNPSEFYSKVYISEDIVNNYRTLPGIKSATKIANVLFADVLKASTCAFSADTETLDAIDIDVCALSAMAELCRFDLEQSFISMEMVKGSNGSFEVPSFMAYYWDEMAKEIAAEVADLRWNGSTTGATGSYRDLCDGHLKKLLADATVVDVANVAITAANVIAELGKGLQALPAAVQGKTNDLRFYVSANIMTAFRIAAASGNSTSFITKDLEFSFLGIKIVVVESMPSDTYVLTVKDNLIYAFDGEGDAKALKAINLEDTVAEPLLRTRTNLKVGFYHVNGAEIVLYS